MLAKFTNNFSSLSPILNIIYKTVVIKGTIHNGIPEATTTWMKRGSFWK
ncbi:DUF4437 domain-containing protein [Tenacibaculum soleae]